MNRCLSQQAKTQGIKDCSPKKALREENDHLNVNQEVSSSKFNAGRWTHQEHILFCQIYQKVGKDWKSIARYIPSRTAQQVRSHAQKYLSRKLRKEEEQKEIQEAQKLLQEKSNKRVVRARKICQPYGQQELHVPASNFDLTRKVKTEINIPDIIQIDNQEKERASLRSISEVNSQEGEKIECKEETKTKCCQTQQTIHVPEPDTVPFYYSSQTTSYLYQTLLPFLILGMPLPIFIHDNQVSTENKPKKISEESKEKSKSMIDIMEGQSYVKFNPGFVRVNRNDQNVRETDNLFLKCENKKEEPTNKKKKISSKNGVKQTKLDDQWLGNKYTPHIVSKNVGTRKCLRSCSTIMFE